MMPSMSRGPEGTRSNRAAAHLAPDGNPLAPIRFQDFNRALLKHLGNLEELCADFEELRAGFSDSGALEAPEQHRDPRLASSRWITLSNAYAEDPKDLYVGTDGPIVCDLRRDLSKRSGKLQSVSVRQDDGVSDFTPEEGEIDVDCAIQKPAPAPSESDASQYRSQEDKVDAEDAEETFTTLLDDKAAKIAEILSYSQADHLVMTGYKRDGPRDYFRRIQHSWQLQNALLDTVMGVVIILNCLVIGMSLDMADGSATWLALDGLFVFAFLGEALLKMWMEGRSSCARAQGKDKDRPITRSQFVRAGIRGYFVGPERVWHWFEFSLVVLAVVEFIVAAWGMASGSDFASGSSNFTLMRLLRLVRITRLIRVCQLSMFADLMVMIKGAIGGIKTLIWSAVLICVPMYACTLVFRETIGSDPSLGHGGELFATVPLAFFTLFRCIVGGECTDMLGRPLFAHITSFYGWAVGFFYCAVQFFMVFGLFNVIVAIFVENVINGARKNNAMMKRHRLMDKRYFADKMMAIVAHVVSVSCQSDRQSAGRRTGITLASNLQEAVHKACQIDITPGMFQTLMSITDVQELLRDLDIAEEDTLTLFETLDADGSGTIDMWELFDGIQKLRGHARRGDIVAVNIMVHKVLAELGDVRVSKVDAENGVAEIMRSVQRQASRLSGRMCGGLPTQWTGVTI